MQKNSVFELHEYSSSDLQVYLGCPLGSVVVTLDAGCINVAIYSLSVSVSPVSEFDYMISGDLASSVLKTLLEESSSIVSVVGHNTSVRVEYKEIGLKVSIFDGDMMKRAVSVPASNLTLENQDNDLKDNLLADDAAFKCDGLIQDLLSFDSGNDGDDLTTRAAKRLSELEGFVKDITLFLCARSAHHDLSPSEQNILLNARYVLGVNQKGSSYNDK